MDDLEEILNKNSFKRDTQFNEDIYIHAKLALIDSYNKCIDDIRNILYYSECIVNAEIFEKIKKLKK